MNSTGVIISTERADVGQAMNPGYIVFRGSVKLPILLSYPPEYKNFRVQGLCVTFGSAHARDVISASPRASKDRG